MSNKRIAAVALFHLRIGVAREVMPLEQAREPLAVVIGAQEERELQGGTRLDEVSIEAFELGVRPGMTLAAARAKAAHLLVRVVKPQSVEAAVARLAESLLTFGATVAYVIADDAVFVDVTGCGHLHACAADPSGEGVLAAKLGAHVRKLGFAARIAISSGPRIAHAVARFAPVSPSRGKQSEPKAIVVLPGTERDAIGALSIGALPLDEGTHRYLRKLGVDVVADLASLPADGLGSRLGPLAAEVLALARGDDRAPLTPYVPPAVPEERIDLDDPVDRTDALLFIAKALADRMGARLEGRGYRASALDLVFELERSFVPEGQSPRAELALKLAAPIGAAGELLAIMKARLESYEVVAPIKAVVLRCRDLAPATARALSLFEAEPKADRVLPELAAELTTLLGREKVGLLSVSDTWRLEARTELVPYADAIEARGRERAIRARSPRWAGEEPLRMLPARKPAPLPRVAPLVVRHESVEWWRKDAPAPRDFAVAWDEDAQAPAWLEIDRATGRAWIRGWKE